MSRLVSPRLLLTSAIAAGLLTLSGGLHAAAPTHVAIETNASAPVAYQAQSTADGTLRVDLPGVKAKDVRAPAAVGAVKSVKVSETKTGAHLELNVAAASYDVQVKDGKVQLALTPQDGPRVAMAPRDEMGMEYGDVDEGSGVAGVRHMTFIGFINKPSESRVFARMNDKATYRVRREGPGMVVLEIQNATVPLRNNRRFMDSSHFNSPVNLITPSVVDDVSPLIRIMIELDEDVPFSTIEEGTDVVLVFKKGGRGE